MRTRLVAGGGAAANLAFNSNSHSASPPPSSGYRGKQRNKMHGLTQPQRRTTPLADDKAGLLVHLCVAAAQSCCIIVLTAWCAGNLNAAGFGSSRYPMQPLTATGFLFITLALIASIRRWQGTAALLLIPPFTITGLATFQYCTGISPGIDRLMFADSVLHQIRFYPGRPGPMAIATMLALSLATMLSIQRGYRQSQLIVLIASLVFGVAMISGGAIPLGVVHLSTARPHALLSMPTAITACALSIALIAWHHNSGWPGLLSARGIEGRTLRTIFMLVLLAPAVLALTSLWAVRQPGVSPELVEIGEAGAHIVLSAAILFWAWSRIARENSARWAVTRALDSAPIVLTNRHGEIIHWSKGCERLYQWPAEEATGRIKHDLLRASLPQGWDQLVQRLRNGLTYEKEIVEYRRDGVPIHILEQARMLPVRHGDEPVIVLSMTDITVREQRAAALQARESELLSILEAAPDAIITLDEQGRIRSVSATAERLFAYPAEAMLGQSFRMLIPTRYWAAHDIAIERYHRDRGTLPRRQSQRLSVLRSDGTEVPIELSIGEALIGQERIFTGFIRDLRETLAAQQRQAELRDELLHVSRLSAMGEMAAGLAHELNQPLAAAANFLGAADMLLADRGKDSAQILQLVRMASGQTLRAGDLIRRLRAFVSKGDVEIRAEAVNEVVADAVCLALTSAEQQRIDIHYDLDRTHMTILADRVQVQQVLVNLIRNAIEALRDQANATPRITLTSRAVDNGMIEIAVSDNGPGIAPEIFHRPYEPFVSTKAYGMGIGLSICRRIVEFHGGTLTAENMSEGGARIAFTVPATADTEAVPA